MRPTRRLAAQILMAALLVVGASACTGDSSSSSSSIAATAPGAQPAPGAPAEAPVATQPVTLNVIDTPPGVADDGFVGAASDVTTEQCAKVGAQWEASGTVKNESGSDAKYRIYVAFNVKDSTDTRALIQTNADVANGKSAPWKATAAIADEGLSCILRVERVKV